MTPELLASLEIGAVFRESEYACVDLVFSRDGSALGAGFEDGTVSMIGTDDGIVKFTHRSHKYGLSKLALLNQDAKGRTAVVAASPSITTDYSLRIWDLALNRFIRVLKAHECAFESVSTHSNLDILISTSTDGLSCLWDLREEKPVWQCREASGSVSAFDKAEGSNTFAVTSPKTKTVSLFGLRNFQSPTHEVKCLRDPVHEIRFARNGAFFLAANHSLGVVSTVKLDKLEKVDSMYFLPPSKGKFRLSISPCCQFALATTAASNNIDIWDIFKRLKVRTLSGHGGPPVAEFSPTHTMIASASMPVALWVPYPTS